MKLRWLTLAFAASFALAGQAATPVADVDFLKAVDRGDTDQVKEMLAAGANPNARDDHGDPALTSALHANQYPVAAILVRAPGVDLDADNAHGQTALMVAAYLGRVELVRALIQAGAEVQHTGWSALHYAAMGGQLKVVQVLLEQGAYVDALSSSRTTPLMMAARIKDEAVCQALIDAGADPTPTNDAGLDAAAFARKAGDQVLADWFGRQADAWRVRHAQDAPVTPLAPAPESGESTRPDGAVPAS